MLKHSIILYILSFALLWSCTKNSSPSVEPLSSPSKPGSQLPRLVSDAEGNLFMSWVETDSPNKNMAVLKYARLDGDNWISPRPVTEGDNWFVNWADFPSLTVVSGQPAAAHWLQKVPGNTYSYHVKIAVFKEGEGWSSSITPHFDNTATEHGFVSMIPWEETGILAIWLDGRQTANREEGEYFNMNKTMTLRSAVISEDGSVSSGSLIDDIVCDCCQTALVETPYGALAAYRDRTEGEIRDIYLSRYINGNWSDPEAVHDDGWKIGACPVNGPALAIYDSVAVVAWYTGADNQPRVKAAISTDAGKAFTSPVVISNEQPVGRVDAAVNSDGTAFISWMEQTSETDKAELRVRTLSSTGTLGAPKVVTSMNSSRRSGFPQMELQGNRLIFAWTDIGDVPQVKVAALSSVFED